MALLATVVRRALRGVELTPADQAAAQLAIEYAQLIDEARPAATFGEPLRYLAGLVEDDQGRRHLHKIEAALAAHSVASDFGPKLLAALAALGMTPASRKALVKEASSGPTSPLDELRQRRAARAAR